MAFRVFIYNQFDRLLELGNDDCYLLFVYRSTTQRKRNATRSDHFISICFYCSVRFYICIFVYPCIYFRGNVPPLPTTTKTKSEKGLDGNMVFVEYWNICHLSDARKSIERSFYQANWSGEHYREKKIIWGSINEDIANIVVLSMYKIHLIHSKLQR